MGEVLNCFEADVVRDGKASRLSRHDRRCRAVVRTSTLGMKNPAEAGFS
jgi:hypothetical protein